LKGGGAGEAGSAPPPVAEEDLPAEVAREAEITDDDMVILEGELLDAAAAAGLPQLSELEVALAERDEYLDALRRLQADFDNFRKRVRRQEEESSAYHVASLMERLLPVLDALELAASHAKSEDVPVFNQVAQLLRDALAKEGLEKIDADGVPFEPTIHDAVAHVPASDDDQESGGTAGAVDGPVVEEVLRTGYSVKGKVLRPAMVKVRG
jgi:molecular chaperone GrpE